MLPFRAVRPRLTLPRTVAGWALGGAVTAALFNACIARDGDRLRRLTDDAGGGTGGIVLEDGAGGGSTTDAPVGDPHAVLGIDPAHGPFAGGQQSIVRGNGFSGAVRVWFGDREVSAAGVVPVDSRRVQVEVPPGSAGAVDVTAQNGDDASTRRTLPGAYQYDTFYASPSSGPTSGGTVITLRGQGTTWDAGTRVLVDLRECTALSVESATELTCAVPPGTPGAKVVRVTTSDGVKADVLDAFTYGDSDNGFKGGLSGDPLAGTLEVLALDNYQGTGIQGATVIVSEAGGATVVQQTASSGGTVFTGASLTGKRTVTIAKKCFQPVTFVDVPVSRVTAYLDPILTPACGSEGDPPPVGGTPGVSSSVKGELVWPQSKEFGHEGWTNVPAPRSDDEKLVAYVLRLSSDPTRPFQLPDATSAVTPAAVGTSGFTFQLSATAGNLTLYALSGIENRALVPPVFTAYSVGVLTGVGVNPGGTTQDVFVSVDIPLDHALSIVTDTPAVTPKGPDRVQVTASVRYGELGFLLLPGGSGSALWPALDPFRIVGVPPLSGALANARYAASASAVTGTSSGTPRSVVGLVTTNVSGAPLVVDTFVEIPVITEPALNSSWSGTQVDVDWAPGGASVDLVMLEVESPGAIVSWTVVAPGAQHSIALPDLASIDPELGLPHGPLSVSTTLAHIAAFDYGQLRYRHLTTRGWDAYAKDVAFTTY